MAAAPSDAATPAAAQRPASLQPGSLLAPSVARRRLGEGTSSGGQSTAQCVRCQARLCNDASREWPRVCWQSAVCSTGWPAAPQESTGRFLSNTGFPLTPRLPRLLPPLYPPTDHGLHTERRCAHWLIDIGSRLGVASEILLRGLPPARWSFSTASYQPNDEGGGEYEERLQEAV